jgi:hypothetical protein
VDWIVRYDGNAVPVSDAEIVSSSDDRVIRIQKRIQERCGIPAGNGATVDLVIQGVVVDDE